MKYYLKNIRSRFASSSLLQSAAAFSVRSGAALSSFILFAVISNFTGSFEFGVFSMYFSIVMTLGLVGSFGQQIFLVKEIPRARVDANSAREKGAFLFAFISTSAAAIVSVAAFVLLAEQFFSSGSSPAVVVFGAALVGLYAASQTTMGALRVKDRTIYAMASRDLLWRIVSILLILALPFASTNLIAMDRVGQVFLALALGLAPIVIAHVHEVSSFVRSSLSGVEADIRYREWTDSSAGLLFVSLISSSDLYVYTLIIGVLLGPVEAGAFFAALKTVEVLNIFLMAVTLVVAPQLSRAISEKNRDKFQLVCNKSTILQGVPALVACVAVFIAAEHLMSLFDERYAAYSNVLRLVAVGMLANALTGATVLILQLIGKHWLQVALQGGSLLLGVIVAFPLCHYLGVYGAGVSFIISKLLWNIAAISVIKTNNGVDPSLFGLFDRQTEGVRGAIREIRTELDARGDAR